MRGLAAMGPTTADRHPTVSIRAAAADEIRTFAANAPGGRGWTYEGHALSPAGLGRAAADARWRTTVLVAEQLGRPVGLLPVFQLKGARFPAPMFDPGHVAPALFRSVDADRFLLIGGHTELVSGCTLAADLTDRLAVASALVTAAFRLAAERDLVGAALYVRDRQLTAFRGPRAVRGVEAVGEMLTLPVPPDGVAGYLGGLSAGRRSMVRRDWRDLRAAGLTVACGPPGDVLDEAVPLIQAVKARHGTGDHPALIRLRMREWLATTGNGGVAFSVRSGSGGLVAISFGVTWGHTLELYEIGLREDAEDRHSAYVEALVYSPLRRAIEHGCERVLLGLNSAQPKRLRGARSAPVWAVSATSADRAPDETSD